MLVSRPPIVWIGTISIPSTSRGTQIIVSPSCLDSPLVVRQTISTWSAMWALEMKTFWPLITKPPSTRSAEVVSEPTSEPDSGSVIAIASTEPPAIAAEDLRLLLLGAEALGRAGDDQRRRVAADRRQAARGLFHEEGRVEHRAAGAAVLLGDRDPEPAELGHLLVEVEVVVALVSRR